MDDADWLKTNKPLRLDANEGVFDAGRRAFHLQRYAFAQGHVDGLRVLDVACGTGYGSAVLAERALSVTGVDFSPEAIDYATKRYASPAVQFQVGFAELTGLPAAAFDAVVSFETLEHLISPAHGIREYRRVMRPNGVLIASVPNNWGYTSHHFFDFNFGLLKALISDGFEEAAYFYQNSGRKRRFMPVGIGPLTRELQDRCECLLVVASRPKPDQSGDGDPVALLVRELYKNAFDRHRAFLRYERLFRKFRFDGIAASLLPLLSRGPRTGRSNPS